MNNQFIEYFKCRLLILFEFFWNLQPYKTKGANNILSIWSRKKKNKFNAYWNVFRNPYENFFALKVTNPDDTLWIHHIDYSQPELGLSLCHLLLSVDNSICMKTSSPLKSTELVVPRNLIRLMFMFCLVFHLVVFSVCRFKNLSSIVAINYSIKCFPHQGFICICATDPTHYAGFLFSLFYRCRAVKLIIETSEWKLTFAAISTNRVSVDRTRQ